MDTPCAAVVLKAGWMEGIGVDVQKARSHPCLSEDILVLAFIPTLLRAPQNQSASVGERREAVCGTAASPSASHTVTLFLTHVENPQSHASPDIGLLKALAWRGLQGRSPLPSCFPALIPDLIPALIPDIIATLIRDAKSLHQIRATKTR